MRIITKFSGSSLQFVARSAVNPGENSYKPHMLEFTVNWPHFWRWQLRPMSNQSLRLLVEAGSSSWYAPGMRQREQERNKKTTAKSLPCYCYHTVLTHVVCARLGHRIIYIRTPLLSSREVNNGAVRSFA